jgi:hypothetical protein
VGASKLCIVQLVGNKFVYTTVQGLVENGEVFNLKIKFKILFSINGNVTQSPHE